MSKSITDLRDILFATLEGIKTGAVDLDKARNINEVAKTIVDTAKLEVEYLRVTNGDKSTFIGKPSDGASNLPNSITGVTQHRDKG